MKALSYKEKAIFWPYEQIVYHDDASSRKSLPVKKKQIFLPKT
jgi:hypothetical protein